MVLKMARCVAVARTAKKDPEDLPLVAIGKQSGGIVFSLTKIPPRLRPMGGDWCRWVGEENPPEGFAEGRVTEDQGETLVVQRRGGIPAIVNVPANMVMKVFDWPADMR